MKKSPQKLMKESAITTTNATETKANVTIVIFDRGFSDSSASPESMRKYL